MIFFVLGNCVVALSAYLITFRVLKLKSSIDSLIAFFIVCCGQIVFTETLLGVLGLLFLKQLMLLNLCILGIVFFTVRSEKTELRLPPLKVLLPIFSQNFGIRFACVMLAVFACVKVLINAAHAPFGWDCLNYHFTFPVEWLKTGFLHNPITISDDPAPPYYPVNGNLIYLWFMLPFKSVFIADLGQVLFFFLAFAAIYSLARKLSVSVRNALSAAILFTLIPNYFKQLQIAYVDVMVAALFFTVLNFILLAERSFSLRHLLLICLSAGLLIGTKTVALPYAFLLFLPGAYLIFIHRKETGWMGIWCLVSVIVLGGFTYARNIYDTGNPLYPAEIVIAGKTIFKGVINSETYRAHFKPSDYALSKVLFREGIGAQSILLVLPSLFLGVGVFLKRKKLGLGFCAAYLFLIPCFVYAVYRFVIPLANTRYLYPLFGVGMVAAFFFVERMRLSGKQVGFLVFLCAAASLSELAKRQELVFSGILTIILFFLAPFCFRLLKKLFILRVQWLVFFFSAVICFSVYLYEPVYVKNEYSSYVKMVKYSGFWPDAVRGWEWLNNNTSGNTIAYVGRPVAFPLYGERFKNNVFYVSVNACEPAKLHFFKQGRYAWGDSFLDMHSSFEAIGNYRSGADYGIWLKNLRKRGVDFFFVYSLHQTEEVAFPVEDEWASRHAEHFERVFSNPTIHIYKVIK